MQLFQKTAKLPLYLINPKQFRTVSIKNSNTMENIQSFSFKRIFLMMQKTLYENGKSVIIGLSTVFGIFSFILIISLLNTHGQAWNNLTDFYYGGFFIAGLFISGMAFSNFRNKEKTISYITLPASVLEKFISEWLLTTIVFTVGYTAIFYLFNLLVLLFGNMLHIDVNIINIFNSEFLSVFFKYIIVQSMFLAGAATFKKSPFFKTIFSLFLFNIFIIVWLSVVIYFAKGAFETVSFNDYGAFNIGNNTSYHFENHWLLETAKSIYYYITAPAFWLYTYFKLKEKEA